MSVQLKSKEQDVHDVPLEVAQMSRLVVDILGDADEDEEQPPIDMLKVSNPILTKVIDFCRHYKEVEAMKPIETPLKSAKIEDLVQPWYVDFVKVDQKTLFELVAAANYMDIKELLDLTCLGVSILCQNKSADELRKMFKVEKAPDDEAKVQAS